MKKIIQISIMVIIIFSCSNEEVEIAPPVSENSLTNYIYKRYDVTNTPNTIIDSANYAINNSRIVSHSGMNFTTQNEYSGNYNYTGGKLASIESFNEGALARLQSFTYNTNGDLIEYLSETVDASGSSSFFNRHIFTHTTDTIFSSWTTSNNGIDYSPKQDSKIVLDDNNNRTYFEAYNYINDDIRYILSLYDSNSNITNESYNSIIDGSDFLSFENTYLTNNSENYFNTINEATYGRRSYMLLYHLLPNSVNSINAKSITKNSLTVFNSTWGNSFASFEISNLTDENNRIIFSDLKTVINGEVFNRFSQEYLFQ